MQALGKIRSDLRAIRYYYARKPFFDSAGYVTGTHEVVGLAARYNEVMRSASPQLYDLYVGLYVRNSTQEAFSEERSYTQDYIQRQNKRLLQFLQAKI